ncbi:hypothetical protein D4R52_03665 [bacterium]|nr:MAG: hypothetical protein D4R52_03665 [bacterium]
MYIIIALALLPFVAQAFSLVPCGQSGVPATDPAAAPCELKHLVLAVIVLTNYLISVAAAVAIYEVLNAGFNLVTSLGNEEKIKKNKEGISNAVVGFGIVILAFIFVNLLVNGLFGNGPTSGADKQRPWWDPKCVYQIGDNSGCPMGPAGISGPTMQ